MHRAVPRCSSSGSVSNIHRLHRIVRVLFALKNGAERDSLERNTRKTLKKYLGKTERYTSRAAPALSVDAELAFERSREDFLRALFKPGKGLAIRTGLLAANNILEPLQHLGGAHVVLFFWG